MISEANVVAETLQAQWSEASWKAVPLFAVLSKFGIALQQGMRGRHRLVVPLRTEDIAIVFFLLPPNVVFSFGQLFRVVRGQVVAGLALHFVHEIGRDVLI